MCAFVTSAPVSMNISVALISPSMHYEPNLDSVFMFSANMIGALIILRTISIQEPNDFFEVKDVGGRRIGYITGDFSDNGANEHLEFFGSSEEITARFFSDSSGSLRIGISGTAEPLDVFISEVVLAPDAFIIPALAEDQDFGYFENIVTACEICTIQLTISENNNHIIIYDGEDSLSPELGRILAGDSAPFPSFHSTGNKLFVKILNEFNRNNDTTGVYEEIFPPLLQCGEVTQIYISNEALDQLDFRPQDSLVISDEIISASELGNVYNECKDRFTPEDDLHFFRFNRSSCGVIQENGTDITFTYTLVKVSLPLASDVIRRVPDACLTLSCMFSTEISLDSDVEDFDLQWKVKYSEPTTEGEFYADFSFFKSSAFYNIAEVPIEVEVPDYVYFGIEVDVPTNQILEVEQCWATNCSNPEQLEPRHYLVEESCASSDEYGGEPAVNISHNKESYYVEVIFRSFEWVLSNTQEIYVFCVVTVCDSMLDDTCKEKPVCPPITRRSISLRKKRQTVGLGPVIMRKSEFETENLCLEDNGGCERICTYNGYAAICSCLPEEHLLDDGKSCAGSEEKIEDERFNDPMTIILEVIILVLSFVVVVSIILSIRRRRSDVLKV